MVLKIHVAKIASLSSAFYHESFVTLRQEDYAIQRCSSGFLEVKLHLMFEERGFRGGHLAFNLRAFVV